MDKNFATDYLTDTYSKIILTDVMEFYIIELPKFSKYKGKKKELNNWIKFIKARRKEEVEDR